MGSRYLNPKKAIFLLFVLTFISPSLLHFVQLMRGTQPSLNYEIPLAGALFQQTLLFDRTREFFGQHHFLIIHKSGKEEISRDEFLHLVPSYLERLLFWHWAGYVAHPERAQALLRHYLCCLPNDKQANIEWQVVAPRTGSIEWKTETTCN